MEMTGAKIVLECLLEQNVKKVFGYPGGTIMPVYDAMYDYMDQIDHVLTAHEQGASHAADGYARSTGEVGVCFATSGPGATNTVTGIATAYLDSIPMVVITGQVPLSMIGKDSFQEVDITGITLPVTKHNVFISDVKQIAPRIREAFRIAKSGRPGPVLIDIPKDIMFHLCEYNKEQASEKEHIKPYNEKSLYKVAELIKRAKKPVIFAGGGVLISEASEELKELSVKNQIPVLNTLMGLGSFPRDHENSLGMIGMHGSREANLAMNNSDLIIAIGARFSDRVTGNTEKFARKAMVIHIDVDESEISKNIKAHYSCIGDIKDILGKLNPLTETVNRSEWLAEIRNWKRPIRNLTDFIPENIMKTMSDAMGKDAIVVTEVGQHQMWTAQSWPFTKPKTFITSGGLGTMGFGLGAAIGVKTGNPDTPVIHIAGDGSFRMNCNELVTVAAQKLPLITIVIKNNTLGMVRQWQKLFHDERYSSTDLQDVVDYVKLAGAYGIEGRETNSLSLLHKYIEEARTKNIAMLIVCDMSIDENVFPIVPPGEEISNQMFE